MKRFLLLPLLMLVLLANAKTYYVSASGSDANTGTSATAAWKSITKLNSFVFAANDSILFNRGDVFYGSVIANRNNLIFSAYGTGAKPVITGFTAVSSWKSLGGGIYEAAVNAKANLNMVTINGRPQQIGRYPNAGDANGGYLTYETFGATSITDNQLSTTVNWTGAEAGIRKNSWGLDRVIITSQSGGTINYKMGENINSDYASAKTLWDGNPNFGYFFMNDVRTLDQFGEWYYDATAKKIKVYFGTAAPAGYSVQVSTVDTLFNLSNRTNINISNISLEGANMSAVFSLRGGYINIQNCDMTNIGVKAIHIFDSPNILIENVNTTNVLSNAIQVLDRYQPNVTIRNCNVRNTAPFAGMGSYYEDADYKAIYAIVSNNLLIESNHVDTSGLSGIQFNGSDVVIKNNVINYFNYVLQDGGGIYTWVGGSDAQPKANYTNRIVSNNIIMNGVGAPAGTSSPKPDFCGIFLDDRTMNIKIWDNTVFNCDKAIQANTPAGVSLRGNILYNNLYDFTVTHKDGATIKNLSITKNVSFPTNANQVNFRYVDMAMNYPVTTTLQNSLKSIGLIDSNYYNTFSGTGIITEMHEYSGAPLLQSSPYSLEAWRSFTNHDMVTKRPAQKIQPYTIINTIGSNLITNGEFTSNINGATVWGNGTTGAWDNTSKVSGTGSLRMDFSDPQANKYSLLYGSVGAVSSNKKYVLRFTTLGTKVSGIVTAYLRKSASPYTNLVPIQTRTFGAAKTVHEIFIDAPITESSASFVISVETTSGTTYIDKVEFIEVNATINTFESQVKFLYNDTKLSKTIALDAKYIGVDSTVYNGSITLAPYSSKIIVNAGPVSGVLPVKLINFSAKDLGNKVEVKWVTTSEINSSHYLVERSTDGHQFESIARVVSNNNADLQNTYGHTDMLPVNGMLYYRLAMIDKDGSIAYSKIVTINIKNAKTFVIENVKLSAGSSSLKINVSTSESQLLSFAVADVSGRIVVAKNIQLQAGTNNIIANIPAISKGIYYVKMQTPGALITKAVLRE